MAPREVESAMWIVLFQLAILYICETVLIALKFPIVHISWTERVRNRELN
jgi:hypothetical protein